jgi:hypothetical protein
MTCVPLEAAGAAWASRQSSGDRDDTIGRRTHFDGRHNGGHIAKRKRADAAAQGWWNRSLHRSARHRAGRPPRRPGGSAQARSAAWSQTRSPREHAPRCGGPRLRPMASADTADRRSAGWHDDWRSTASPPPPPSRGQALTIGLFAALPAARSACPITLLNPRHTWQTAIHCPPKPGQPHQPPIR